MYRPQQSAPKDGESGFGRRPVEVSPYARYEALKAVWFANHPEATPREVEAAMRRIADEAGI